MQSPEVRPYYHLFFLIFFCAGLDLEPVSAQYEQLLHKTYADRAPALWRIGDSIFYQPDSNRAMDIANRLVEFGKSRQDPALQLEGELYKVFYIWGHDFTPNKEKVFRGLGDILNRSIRSGVWEVELKTRTLLADYYWEGIHNYELGMEEYAILDRLLQSRSYAEYPEKTLVMYKIGNANYDFKDYGKAIQYFRRVPGLMKEARFQPYVFLNAFNKISLAYRQMGNLDSSDYYLHQLYDTCAEYAGGKAKYKEGIWSEADDSTWIYVVQGDMGYNAYLRGNNEAAVRLLNAAVDRAIAIKDWDMAVEYLMPLADAYFKTNLRPEAIEATVRSANWIRDEVVPERKFQCYRQLYPLLAKMYAVEGKESLSRQYTDSMVFVIDSLDRQFSGLLMARAIQREAINAEKEEQAARKLLTFQLYGVLILALIGAGVAVYIYRTNRIRHRREQELARTQLYELTAHMAEKNQLIEKLEARLGNSQVLEKLDGAVILTEADWRKFRELFEQVHPGYLDRLTEKVPGISPAEIRLMALAKLGFSNKEMAGTLGVTPQAIRVAWHRLRKKLELPEEETLEGLVAMIG